MTNVVERLRDTASKGVSVWGDLQMDAADEIDRLQERISALERDSDRLHSIYLGVTNDGYGWWLPEWCVRVGETAPRFDEFQAQIDAEGAAIVATARKATP